LSSPPITRITGSVRRTHDQRPPHGFFSALVPMHTGILACLLVAHVLSTAVAARSDGRFRHRFIAALNHREQLQGGYEASLVV
jgi:hypothetical protein